ncbi:hypothetical protein [Geminocystis sp. GBBB08]|uniref:hypothetical protein n=1 Tax=Geminocystis sp. GBBB08 TaxID=2604140 RepID=UPI0027E29263|nr:hypothetical protein [Geminocystis sp. GBBB08]MBL1211602.1 transcriptional regulator [Geminocystis sp. GBBB08]
MTTKIVNTVKSDLWLNSLIESLADSQYAGEYLTVILEDDPEGDQILMTTLQDIIQAYKNNNRLSESAQEYYQKLEEILVQNGEKSLYLFLKLLKVLNFTISIESK